MLADPIAMTVSAEAYTLNRNVHDGYTGIYFDRSASGQELHTVTVKHTVPSKDGDTESHLFRSDIKVYDSNGVYLRTDSVWTVFKTADGVQDAAALKNLFKAQYATLTANTDAELNKLLDRNS